MLNYKPFPFSIARSRQTWDNLIQKYGTLALLRQPVMADRWISAMAAGGSASERLGMVANPLDHVLLISALSPETGEELDLDPSEKDVVVILATNDDGSPVLDSVGKPQEYGLLKIVAPPEPAGPNNTPLYWRLQVRA